MRSFLLRSFALIIFILFRTACFSQTPVTLITCDTIISFPNKNFMVGNYALTFKSANNTRLGYSVIGFNSNSGNVNIYDGLNNNARLITVLGDPFSIPNQIYGAQSTGIALTFAFATTYLERFSEHFNVVIKCVATPAAAALLQPLQSLGVTGNVKAADYDKDGDQDLIIGGKVLRNDSYFDSAYKFERKANVIDGWSKVNTCSADFDGDGYKDIFITGNATIFDGVFGPKAAIYRNNGNNTFSLVTSQLFIGAARGGCSIVDFNKDGKPDICYTGSTKYSLNDALVFKVYINNGKMGFTDANITLPGIPGLLKASISFADSDDDGDLDLLINGHNGTSNVTAFFTNAGSNFTNQNLPITATSAGAISWIDVNMDGKPDIVNTGVASADNIDAIVPQIYFNKGNNHFLYTATNLPERAFVSSDWADYDHDNDQDIVLGGWTLPTGTGSDAGVYKNNGNGQFTRVSGLGGAIKPTKVKWVDFNHDGRPDIISGGYFIKNMGADSFRIASFSATTKENYPEATVIDDLNNDGYPDILLTGGDMTDVDCNGANFSTLVVGKSWQLSGIPKFTQVADVTPLNPIDNGGYFTSLFYQWGDFDSDGKLDIIMTGDNAANNGSHFLVVYKNNGNNNFSLFFNSQVTPLPGTPGNFSPQIRCVGLFDIDNDGINEIFTGPNNVYKNIGGKWSLSSYSSTNTAGDAISIDFADYNSDGFMDAVMSASSGIIVFKNDGAGHMVNISTPPQGYSYGVVGGTAQRQVQWADINNDGHPDIISSNGVYMNRNDSFIFIRNPILPFVHAAVGDYNNDGFRDLVTVPYNTDMGPMEMHLSEQGTGFYSKGSMGTITQPLYNYQIYNQAAVGFDVDNDGDDDIVFSGGAGCAGSAQVIVNEGSFTKELMHVVSPNGAENYLAGSSAEIKWYGSLISNTVKIEISRDSGLSWQVVAASVASTANGGTYLWKPSAPLSKKCFIKISDNVNTNFTDQSNAVFTISASVILVVNAHAGNDTAICLGSTAHIGTTASANNTYSWISSDGNFSSSMSAFDVSPLVTTTYYLTVTNGALSANDTVTVTVSSVKVILPKTLLNVCIGNTYSIGTIQQQSLLYNWTSKPAGFTSSQPNPVIYPATIGDTVYYVLAKNTLTGCFNSASVHVITDSCSIPLNNWVVILYPNPVNDQLIIRLHPGNSLPVNFKLVSSNGFTAVSQVLYSLTTHINVSSFQDGTYLYNIKSSSGKLIRSGSLSIVH